MKKSWENWPAWPGCCEVPQMAIYHLVSGSDGKESACNVETWVQYLGQERSAGGGQGYPLQYSCLEHSMDRGAWQVTVHAVSKSRTQLSDLTLSLSLTSMFKQPAQPYQCVSAVYWAQVSSFICKNPIRRFSLLHFSHTHALSIRSEQNEPPNYMVWLKAVQRGWQDIWS